MAVDSKVQTAKLADSYLVNLIEDPTEMRTPSEINPLLKDMIGQMAKECEQKKPQKIMPPRLKKLTEALNLATNESDQWKELHHSRKNQYNMAKVGKNIRSNYYLGHKKYCLHYLN